MAQQQECTYLPYHHHSLGMIPIQGLNAATELILSAASKPGLL